MRRARIKRKTPLKVQNITRKAALFKRNYGSKAVVTWLHNQPCVVPDCVNLDIEAAHVKSRGAGGTWEDLVPLCRWHHEEQGAKGINTFQLRHGISLAVLARSFAARTRLLLD